MIPVTRPFTPPINEYIDLLGGIWQRNWLTNNGPIVNDLESRLKEYLNLEELLYVSNGTIALQIAIKALNLKKEIITTPFSYVATTSSIVWEGCTPIFVDIDKETLNIDASKIEERINSNTEAILATHCFGNPCDVESIEGIARKHNLKVIYDAAHCFGTKYKGESIFKWGDISTTSFHATKLFHTIEGGAVFSKNREILNELAWRRNFGHNGPEEFHGVGINAKNSEFHAAMGIVNLKYIEKILESRRLQANYYDENLSSLNIFKPKIGDNVEFNHSYYPIVFETQEQMMKVKLKLERHEIFTRRYFYPSLSSLNYVNQQNTPISDDISSRILCLPMYFELKQVEIDLICKHIISALK